MIKRYDINNSGQFKENPISGQVVLYADIAPLEAKAAMFEWRPIDENTSLGGMLLFWHAGWRHPWYGQLICRDTGEVVLDTPTPEHPQVARYFASHWMLSAPPDDTTRARAMEGK